MNNVEVSSNQEDQSDAERIGQTKLETYRSEAVMPVGRSSENYNMSHKKRGRAVILAYETYANKKIPPRASAKTDAELCKKAFENLGYEVGVHMDLTVKKFLKTLEEVRNEDHTDNDSLVIIFMGHGGIHQDKNIEYLETYDKSVDTQELWQNFTPEKCPTLAGKPKMFYIQACRGEKADKGVKLIAQTDSVDSSVVEKEYVIPLYADMLIMWASYPGNLAFRSHGGGVIEGSVFLHFLTQVLDQYAKNEDLSSMMIRVTRQVAIQYEAQLKINKEEVLSKQIPQTMSTLMRRVYFFESADNA